MCIDSFSVIMDILGIFANWAMCTITSKILLPKKSNSISRRIRRAQKFKNLSTALAVKSQMCLSALHLPPLP